MSVDAILEVQARLKPGVRVGVITGAGISRASGLPTYRGLGGLYDDPAEGAATMEALSARTWRSDPERTWAALASLARPGVAAAPNPAHLALARLEERNEVTILTQNVDGLHQRAGSQRVIEIHGSLARALCLACDDGYRMPPEFPGVHPPRCPRCRSILRPDVVLFEERLPMDKLARIERELLRNPPEILIAVGTSALFSYVNAPFLQAHAAGSLTVEVNPEPTALTPFARLVFREPAELLLPRLFAL